jgi:hypothetical protein
MLVRGSALVLGAALGLVLGCPMELQRGLSCGDGWWDPEFEQCDPRDPNASHLDACRAKGFDIDATCDPQTCTVRASEADCLCQLDEAACEQVCGDGLMHGYEECEPTIQGGFKASACSDYWSTATGIRDKHYASGPDMVGPCNEDNCTFGRNGCTFCGDGELDPGYTDYIAYEGTAEFPAEICDGTAVDLAKLEEHCETKCAGPINGDVVLYCDFECESDCSGFASADDIAVPGQDPAALGCCAAKGSPCPTVGIDNVPDLPCCSWLPSTQGICVETHSSSGIWICP